MAFYSSYQKENEAPLMMGLRSMAGPLTGFSNGPVKPASAKSGLGGTKGSKKPTFTIFEDAPAKSSGPVQSATRKAFADITNRDQLAPSGQSLKPGASKDLQKPKIKNIEVIKPVEQKAQQQQPQPAVLQAPVKVKPIVDPIRKSERLKAVQALKKQMLVPCVLSDEQLDAAMHPADESMLLDAIEYRPPSSSASFSSSSSISQQPPLSVLDDLKPALEAMEEMERLQKAAEEAANAALNFKVEKVEKEEMEPFDDKNHHQLESMLLSDAAYAEALQREELALAACTMSCEDLGMEFESLDGLDLDFSVSS